MASLSHHTEADNSSNQPSTFLVTQTQIEALLYDNEKDIKTKLKKHFEKWDKCVSDAKKKNDLDSSEEACKSKLGDPSYEEGHKCPKCESSESTKDPLKEAIKFNSKSSFALKETETPDVFTGKTKFTKFEAILLEEGMGNLVDAAYYSKEALKSAVPAFEGKKIYANHPSRSDEEDRPERDVRDILGNFDNVRYEEKDGRGYLLGDLIIPKYQTFDWARTYIMHALDFKKKHPDKEFVGLSINASGSATQIPISEAIETAPEQCKEKLLKAQAQGIETINYVTLIEDAVSCDLVTEAGAGGKITKLLEEDRMSKEKIIEAKKDDEKDGGEHKDEKQDKELIHQMIKKHAGDDIMDEKAIEGIEASYSEYKEMGMDEKDAMKHACAAHKLSKHKASKKKEEKASMETDVKDEKKEAEQKPPTETKEAEVVRLAGKVAFLEGENRKLKLEKTIEKTLSESKLPRQATDLFRKQMGEVKTEEEFKKLFSMFTEAYGAKVVSEDQDPFVISVEKQSFDDSESKELTLEDCVE